jgi:SAM-dependent methyltransferase
MRLSYAMTEENLLAHRRGRRHVLNMELIGRTRIRVCEHWTEYRQEIAECVTSEDDVVEVGCHQGVTTEMLARHARRAVGVDLSAKVIAMARERFPKIHFECCAADDISRLRHLGGDRGFSVMFVDINGSRELKTLLPLLESYEATLAPSLIVVKNVKLKRLLLKSSLASGSMQQEPHAEIC